MSTQKRIKQLLLKVVLVWFWMYRGFTKRWRKRWEKGYQRDPVLWVLMDYFIDHANHSDGEVYFPGMGLIPLKRGQHVFGSLRIAEFIGVDRNVIRRKLKILKNLHFLTIQATNKYSIATIINYDLYQGSAPQSDQQNDLKATSKRPASDQQTTTHKELKNYKNEKNEKDPPLKPPQGGADFSIKKFQYPLWLNKPLWFDFVRMRERIKKPITTARTISGLINSLTKIMEKGFSQDLIIQAAIDNCWRSFYAPQSPDRPIQPKTYAQLQDYEGRQQTEALKRLRGIDDHADTKNHYGVLDQPEQNPTGDEKKQR